MASDRISGSASGVPRGSLSQVSPDPWAVVGRFVSGLIACFYSVMLTLPMGTSGSGVLRLSLIVAFSAASASPNFSCSLRTPALCLL